MQTKVIFKGFFHKSLNDENAIKYLFCYRKKYKRPHQLITKVGVSEMKVMQTSLLGLPSKTDQIPSPL